MGGQTLSSLEFPRAAGLPSCFIFTDRDAQRVVGRPSEIEALVNRIFFQAKVFGPLGHRKYTTVKAETTILPRIVALLWTCSPSAVIRRVSTLIINSLKRVAEAWTLSHIYQEIGSRFPSFANRNTPAAVISECGVLGVLTAIHHMCPRRIFRRLKHAVLSLSLPLKLALIAPTRNTTAILEALATHNFLSAAFASTQPARRGATTVSVFIGNRVVKLKDSPASKRLACNVLYLHALSIAQLGGDE